MRPGPVFYVVVFIIVFWGLVLNVAFAWSPECEAQFQESIEAECKVIRCEDL